MTSLKNDRSDGSSGFSLIEILIVGAIISIMASIALVNMAGNHDRGVQLEKEKLISYIKGVQYQAVSGNSPGDVSGKLCGYGFVYDPTPPRLRTYWARSNNKDEPCESLPDIDPSGRRTYTGEEYRLTSDNYVTLLNPGHRFFFKIPDGKLYVDGVNALTLTPSEYDLTIRSTRSGLVEDKVKVYKSGKVQ